MIASFRVKKCISYIFIITISQAIILLPKGMAATSFSLSNKDSLPSTFSNTTQPIKPPVKSEEITNNPEQILARVNNDIITVQDVEKLASNLPQELRSLPKEMLYPQLTKQLIVDHALMIAIQKDGLDKQPAIQKNINTAIRDLTQQKLTQAYLSEKLKPFLTPQAIQHYYNEHYLNQPPIQEVHLRQIIVQTPEIAQIVFQKLHNGQSFPEVARIYSIDLQNREKNKGDIGWLTINELNQPIIQAISQLKNNEYTQQPMETAYGWVIFQKIDERNRPISSLESVEPIIKEQITKETVYNLYEESLKNVHIIEY